MSDFKYVPDYEYRLAVKGAAQRDREHLASAYRKLRQDNPAMARLLYRRARDAECRLADNVFFT